MAQDYVLKDFDIGKDPFKDQNGNTWATAVFEGIGEPVRWVVKDPMKIRVGETFTGDIKEATSKAGKPYMRFYREKKEDFTPQAKKEWQPRDDEGIKAQFAIKASIAFHASNNEASFNDIENGAKEFFAMVERVKAGGTTESATSDDEPEPQYRG